MDTVHIFMDPVHGEGPWTRGPYFVLSRFEDCNNMQLISSDFLTLFVNTTRCRDDFNLNKE